jgi:hypothetical protein
MQDMIWKNKDKGPCEGCGTSLSLKTAKKMKCSNPGGQFLCKKCARVGITCIFFSVLCNNSCLYSLTHMCVGYL